MTELTRLFCLHYFSTVYCHKEVRRGYVVAGVRVIALSIVQDKKCDTTADDTADIEELVNNKKKRYDLHGFVIIFVRGSVICNGKKNNKSFSVFVAINQRSTKFRRWILPY
jgi:hypothetical protein